VTRPPTLPADFAVDKRLFCGIETLCLSASARLPGERDTLLERRDPKLYYTYKVSTLTPETKAFLTLFVYLSVFILPATLDLTPLYTFLGLARATS